MEEEKGFRERFTRTGKIWKRTDDQESDFVKPRPVCFREAVPASLKCQLAFQLLDLAS